MVRIMPLDKLCGIIYKRRMRKPENQLVVKDNWIIERVKYKLTLNQKKMILWAISKIKPGDPPHSEYTYAAHEFAELTNISREKMYQVVAKTAKEIMSKPLFLQNKKGYIIVNWFEKISYINHDATVTFKVNEEMAPHLFNLKKNFTAYQLINTIRLDSIYSIRLYELLKQYVPAGDVNKTLVGLKTILGIEKQYKRYNHFKSRVLEVARKELKARTDIRFKYEEIKTGRRVTSIQFLVFPNTKNTKKDKIMDVLDTQSIEYRTLLNLLPKEQQRKKTIQYKIEQKFRKKGAEYVKRNILYANARANKNYRVFLLKALKEDWGLGWEEDQDTKLADITIEHGQIVTFHGKEHEVQEGNCLHLEDGIVPEGELRKYLLQKGEKQCQTSNT